MNDYPTALLKVTLLGHSYIRKRYFSKPEDTFLVLLADATRRLALSSFVLLCFAWLKMNHPPYMIMTVSITGCSWFAQCSWEIAQMWKVWNGYSYLFQNSMLKITKTQTNQDDARPGKTIPGSSQTRKSPLVLKTTVIGLLLMKRPCMIWAWPVVLNAQMQEWRTEAPCI